MLIKGIIDEDFTNYKKPSMFIAFHSCTFKCEKDCGVRCCQNSELAISPDIEVDISEMTQRYINNPITSAIVCGGLEPFDDWNNLFMLIKEVRKYSYDDIVIYTGYKENEIDDYIKMLSGSFNNIIIKFGRFIPNSISHIDNILGIKLNSENQYSIKIS